MRQRAGGEPYNAYTDDIAVVHLYWDAPAVLQFERAGRLGWIDYISQVGGLLGLCIGFSLMSGIEVCGVEGGLFEWS